MQIINFYFPKVLNCMYRHSCQTALLLGGRPPNSHALLLPCFLDVALGSPPFALLWPQVNIVKKMSYIWVKNVVVFINQRAIFPVSEARFKLSLFLFFLLFVLKFERYVVDISCCVTQLTCASN